MMAKEKSEHPFVTPIVVDDVGMKYIQRQIDGLHEEIREAAYRLQKEGNITVECVKKYNDITSLDMTWITHYAKKLNGAKQRLGQLNGLMCDLNIEKFFAWNNIVQKAEYL